MIKIYDLKINGKEFKSDFNRFERVLKILDERNSESYRRYDLVTDASKRVFVCKRFANFREHIAHLSLEEVKGFIS